MEYRRLGKTGRVFSSEHVGARPDMTVLGKALGAGIVPLAAVIALWQAGGRTRPWNDPTADIALARRGPKNLRSQLRADILDRQRPVGEPGDALDR